MDRFIVVYNDLVPTAIQDRMTGQKYQSDNFEALCELLSGLEHYSDEIIADLTENLTQTINDYEEELDNQRHDRDRTVNDLYTQISNLEDQNYELETQVDSLRAILDQLQPQDASA